MEQIQILEAKVKALEELVEIQSKIISTLKNQPAQIQYVPYQQWYYYPYYWNQYQYYGAQGIAGNTAHNQMGSSGTLTINNQSGLNHQMQAQNAQGASGLNQQYCNSGTVQVDNTLTLAKFR